MKDKDLKELTDEELMEILVSLEAIDETLAKKESNISKKRGNNDENK